MTYYYALWIPQTIKGIPVVLTENQELKILKDDPEDEVPAIKLRGYIDPDSYHIHIGYQCDNALEKELLFRTVKVTEEGFLICQLDVADDDSDYLCNVLRNDGLHNAIYHYIKGFFHEHKYHDSSDDSLLSAYSSDKPIDLDNEDCLREVLVKFLSPYELKYSGYVSETRDTLNTIIERIDKKQGLRDNVELAKSIIQNNIKVLDGESQYCDFLINNFEKSIPAALITEINTQHQELRILNNRLSAIDSYLTSVVSLRLADLSVYLGLWSLVLSVLLFVIPKACSHEDEDRQSILKEYQNIQKGIDSQKIQFDKQLEEMSQNQDSILKLLNKPIYKK